MIMEADIEAAEQEKRELATLVERVAALLTYFTHLVDATGIRPMVCGGRKLRGWKVRPH